MKNLIKALVLSIAAVITTNLGWQDNSTNENGFTIERSNPLNGVFGVIGGTSANVTTFTDSTGLQAGMQYCYRVNAFNDVGKSGYSNTACVVTPTIPKAPSGETAVIVIIP